MPSTGPSNPNAASGIASILVAVDLADDTPDRLRLVAQLADRFRSSIIGIAARNIVVPSAIEFGMAVGPELLDEERNSVYRELTSAEAVFRTTLGSRANVEWCAEVTEGRTWLCNHACLADLVVAGSKPRTSAPADGLRLDPAELVMGQGRPLLVVPPGVDFLSAKRVAIGWKNIRETRRAIADAMPFLRRAETVLVFALGPKADPAGAQDVASHLRLHGIDAEAIVRPGGSPATRVADALCEVAIAHGADLVVCGAYGHSRLREWVFGGVTRDLLANAPICCLMSH